MYLHTSILKSELEPRFFMRCTCNSDEDLCEIRQLHLLYCELIHARLCSVLRLSQRTMYTRFMKKVVLWELQITLIIINRTLQAT